MPTKSKATTYYYYVLIFPFNGMKWEKESHQYLRKLITFCHEKNGFKQTIAVYDQKSNGADNEKILTELEEEGIYIFRTYSVDTCQSWLSGWGYVLDHLLMSDRPKDQHRIILLPGDLVAIQNEKIFFKKLKKFMSCHDSPFVLGDFKGSDPQGTKELIDIYGVDPMIANWFPEVWKAIHSLKILRSRSEFLNIDAYLLRKLLKKRAYAYSQTLNMLILLWHLCFEGSEKRLQDAVQKWNATVKRIFLGTITDDTRGRYYKGATDQIERVERMLRVLWREINDWDTQRSPKKFEKLANEYERLGSRSTKIRDAARIAIWAQMQ